tara:strand:- start:1098 stop:1709 length:612 start_codon:yes stop_codon:yes gene_type:complete
MIYIEYSDKDPKYLEIWGDKTDFYCLYTLLLDIVDESNFSLKKQGISDFFVFHDLMNGTRKAHYGQRLMQNHSKLSHYDHDEVGFEINFYTFIYSWSCVKINHELIENEKLLDSFILMIDHFLERAINNNDNIENPADLLKVIQKKLMKGNKYPYQFMVSGEEAFLEEKDVQKAYALIPVLLQESSPLSTAYRQTLENIKNQQ